MTDGRHFRKARKPCFYLAIFRWGVVVRRLPRYHFELGAWSYEDKRIRRPFAPIDSTSLFLFLCLPLPRGLSKMCGHLPPQDAQPSTYYVVTTISPSQKGIRGSPFLIRSVGLLLDLHESHHDLTISHARRTIEGYHLRVTPVLSARTHAHTGSRRS
ncbi:hypothetical protein BDN70DRAFT_128308 [Pholiota conissans]|uniref:Uncharacterized protein n=1 Tax=Pholiota conissans TaxID=109636 RepID=A0A9P5YWQ5_9AGAR|nr:hypothetical protein BDN70DRAFT_128308 [Pholiota conissans]